MVASACTEGICRDTKIKKLHYADWISFLANDKRHDHLRHLWSYWQNLEHNFACLAADRSSVEICLLLLCTICRSRLR